MRKKYLVFITVLLVVSCIIFNSRYFLLDILWCSITEHFYELRCISMSPKGESKYKQHRVVSKFLSRRFHPKRRQLFPFYFSNITLRTDLLTFRVTGAVFKIVRQLWLILTTLGLQQVKILSDTTQQIRDLLSNKPKFYVHAGKFCGYFICRECVTEVCEAQQNWRGKFS